MNISFNSLVNRVLNEDNELSRQDRIDILKRDKNLLTSGFKFSFVAWDHQDSMPWEQIDALRATKFFPYEFDTALTHPAIYYIFFADIPLTVTICEVLELATFYLNELEDILVYNREEEYYTSYVSYGKLKERIVFLKSKLRDPRHVNQHIDINFLI